MKLKRIAGFSILILLMTLCVHAFAETEETGKAPKVFFPENTHKFPMILEGANVTHDFVIKNNGNAPLEVKNVKTS
jgi:hypothetical protein